jgi:hypothetical protein
VTTHVCVCFDGLTALSGSATDSCEITVPGIGFSTTLIGLGEALMAVSASLTSATVIVNRLVMTYGSAPRSQARTVKTYDGIVSKSRLEKLSYWNKAFRDLEPEEKKLHESLHTDVAKVLSGKKLLLFFNIRI